MLLTDLFLLPSSAWFLTQPMSNCLGVAPPTVGWAIAHINHQSSQCPTHQSDGGTYSQMTLACVNLTKNKAPPQLKKTTRAAPPPTARTHAHTHAATHRSSTTDRHARRLPLSYCPGLSANIHTTPFLPPLLATSMTTDGIPVMLTCRTKPPSQQLRYSWKAAWADAVYLSLALCSLRCFWSRGTQWMTYNRRFFPSDQVQSCSETGLQIRNEIPFIN